MALQRFNDQLRDIIQKRTGRPISDRRLKVVSTLAVIGMMATFAMLSGSNEASVSASPAPTEAPIGIVASSIRPAVLERVQYKDRLAAEATELNTPELRYSLDGPDSTVITTTFGASVDESIIEGYLTGASRKGFPLEDAALKQAGFKAARVANAFGAVWEREVGKPIIKYVGHARTEGEVAEDVKGISAIPIPLVTGDGHHFNTAAPLFISKDAMHVAVRMIVQGVTDPDVLAPYTACRAEAGDSFVLIDGSWTASAVVLTDGASRGCRGWTANEFIAKQ